MIQCFSVNFPSFACSCTSLVVPNILSQRSMLRDFAALKSYFQRWSFRSWNLARWWREVSIWLSKINSEWKLRKWSNHLWLFVFLFFSYSFMPNFHMRITILQNKCENKRIKNAITAFAFLGSELDIAYRMQLRIAKQGKNLFAFYGVRCKTYCLLFANNIYNLNAGFN